MRVILWMKCSLPARIRLVSDSYTGELVRQALNCTRTYFLQQQARSRGSRGGSRAGAAGSRKSRQQATGNSLSGRLTNCVKALQQSANRFRCTSVPCSGALVASAATSRRSRTSNISSRTGWNEAFSLADCDALIKYDYAFDCSSISSRRRRRSLFGAANCGARSLGATQSEGEKEKGERKDWGKERESAITGSVAAPSVVTLAGMLRTCLETKTNSPIRPTLPLTSSKPAPAALTSALVLPPSAAAAAGRQATTAAAAAVDAAHF